MSHDAGVNSSETVAHGADIPERLHRVPSRFGLASILIMMTLMAFLFGVLRAIDSPASLFLFFGTFSVTICLAQMSRGDVPRGVSIVAGSLFLPIWYFASECFLAPGGRGVGESVLRTIALSLPLAISGGILGYLMGVVAAGVFLILDRLERHDSLSAGLAALVGEVRAMHGRSASIRQERRRAAAAMRRVPFRERDGHAMGALPSFNCRLLMKRTADGDYTVRCAVLEMTAVIGPTPREALQRAASEFKSRISAIRVRGEPIPWLDPPLERAELEVEQWVPIHF